MLPREFLPSRKGVPNIFKLGEVSKDAGGGVFSKIALVSLSLLQSPRPGAGLFCKQS